MYRKISRQRNRERMTLTDWLWKFERERLKITQKQIGEQGK